MKPSPLFQNSILLAAVTAWFLAQVLKIPIQYWRKRRWEWVLLLRAGGMPSSHSAFVSAAAHAIGLFQGFNTPLFALAVATGLIELLAGVAMLQRRHSGRKWGIVAGIVSVSIMWTCCAYPFCLGVGVYSLVLLCRESAKQAFE